MNRYHSVHDLNRVVFEIAPKDYILGSLADYEDFSISFKGFLPTGVDTMCCAGLSHSVVSDSLQLMKVSLPGSSVHGDSPGKLYWSGYISFSNLLFDHFPFTLIRGPNISGSYAILFFIASKFTFTFRHVHNLGSKIIADSDCRHEIKTLAS